MRIAAGNTPRTPTARQAAVPSTEQDLNALDRAFFALAPHGRAIVRSVDSYVARHGRIGDGALPVVIIPGFLNDASDLRGMRYFLRGLGFPTHIVETRLRSTASVFDDASAAAEAGEDLMRAHGTDGYVLIGYSRGGLGIEAMRTSMPDRFRSVASAVYLDSPINLTRSGPTTLRLRILGALSRTISSGGRELEADKSIFRGWVASRESGLVAAQRARRDFRAVAFQAHEQDVVPHVSSSLPAITGVTQNVIARGGGGHLIGLGLDIDANTHLAEVLAALPVNASR